MQNVAFIFIMHCRHCAPHATLITPIDIPCGKSGACRKYAVLRFGSKNRRSLRKRRNAPDNTSGARPGSKSAATRTKYKNPALYLL